MSPDSKECSCHPKHARILNDHDKAFVENHNEHIAISETMKTFVPRSMFSLLVLLVIGQLGFTWLTYEKIVGVEKQVIVVQTQLNYHLQMDETKDRPIIANDEVPHDDNS